MINYFVSYSFIKKDTLLTGCCEISIIKEIGTYEHIQEIIKSIEKEFNIKQVVILNYNKLNSINKKTNKKKGE